MSTKRKRAVTYMIDCGQHCRDTEDCEKCVVINSLDRLTFSTLPRNNHVLARLLTMNAEDQQKKSNVYDLAMTVTYIWILSNVYTKAKQLVVKDVEKLYEQFRGLQKYPKNKKGPSYLIKLKEFKETLSALFDIKCHDLQRNKNQTLFWGVRMEEEDLQYYENQKCTPPIGYCTESVDRHALTKTMRMKRRMAYETEQRKESDKYRADMEGLLMDQHIESVIDAELESQIPEDSTEKDYAPEKSDSTARYEYQPTVADVTDDMPSRYQHVRNGLRSVRPEIYRAAHTLNSEYHMSLHQIEGAFVEIGRVFGRDWKAFRPNCTIDNDTLPSMTNLVRTRNYVEAMALNSIVDEIMSSDGGSITYSNDGSALNRVGSFVVQSITVNGMQRALPALSIVTESHETLKELELTTLKILSAATGYKYTESEIVKKISFVMTDSTAHNIGVIQKVCAELDVDEADCPKTLLCNIHPLMMFQNKLKEFYDEIQQSFGTKKLDDCFTVDVDFKDGNFILKAIKCLTNFVNKENSAKPWNRYSHFSQFIAPKPNETIALKDHRFNRLNDCCLVVLYHFEDISEYLAKFEQVTNNMAILDRSFVDMGDVLKPIFCATALLGHHIMRPFQRLLVDVETTYESLLTSFPKLYEELVETDPEQMLTPEQVFKFVPSKLFKETLSKDHLLTNLFNCSKEYKNEVIKILRICLGKFHRGFEKQKGAIFGFGSTANEDTGNVLKIAGLADRSILADTPVHNLGEERSVGMLNYELNFRGREHFNTSSQNLVVNKSTDLITDSFENLNKFKRQAKDIKDLKYQWNKKMKDIEKEGLSTREAASLTEEGKKLRDLEFLKTQNPPGPFTSADEVNEYMKDASVTDAERNERLYIEVRYAKSSSSSMKRSSAVFRLKKNYKRLDPEDYAHNLRVYFGCINSISTITLADFSYILTGLNAASSTMTNVVPPEPVPEQPAPEQTDSGSSPESGQRNVKLDTGAHIAAVWADEVDPTGHTLTWFIGVVEAVDEGGAMVSYLVQTNCNNKSNWMYPETSATYHTPRDQIIALNLSVEYSCATIIRCRIDTKTVCKLNELLSEYLKTV